MTCVSHAFANSWNHTWCCCWKVSSRLTIPVVVWRNCGGPCYCNTTGRPEIIKNSSRVQTIMKMKIELIPLGKEDWTSTDRNEHKSKFFKTTCELNVFVQAAWMRCCWAKPTWSQGAGPNYLQNAILRRRFDTISRWFQTVGRDLLLEIRPVDSQ